MNLKLSTLINSNSKLKNKITNSLINGNINSTSRTNGGINTCGLNIPINSVEDNHIITFINDVYVQGGYHVVKTVGERDAINCCYRKQGMKVVVVGLDLSYIEYRLLSDDCDENIWEQIIVNIDTDESEVDLIEDYSELAEDLLTQRDLNLVLKEIFLNLKLEVEGLDIPTNTSDLINNGENGLDPFITLAEVPPSTNVTNTSDLNNNGEDGIHPFITIEDVPSQTPQVKSDWNAVSGPEEILNKPTIPVLVPQEQSDWNAISGVSFIKNKPTIPAPVDISGKLDKPTTDGTWVVTKSGSTISYTDASTLGQNISNANLTWTVDRTQNLGTKKLSFTNGRFSVPTLEMEVTSANSVPNKVWTDGINFYYTNGAGVNTSITSSYQRNKQFFVPLPATVSEAWKGCIVFFTSSGNLTVPIGLTADFTFNGVVDNGVTLTPAITSPMTWLGTAPAAFSGVAIFTMVRRDGTNNFQILGV